MDAAHDAGTPLTFDPERLRTRLGATELRVVGAPSAGGWSNETVFLLVDGRRLVLRLVPAGESMFPSYDLGLQVRYLEYARAGGLAVPALVDVDPSGDAVGRACFVMEHLDGRVPPDDNPPFTKTGFLFDAPPAQQRRFCESAVDALAVVHSIGPPAFATVGPYIRDHVAWCERLCAWAGIDNADVLAARADLAGDAPPDDAAPASLLWGDARPANMVVDHTFAVAGLLDWELAGSGPGELDVAWFCEMNRMRSVGMGIAALPGFLSVDETWQRWSQRVGRAPTHIGWFHRFSAYRVAVLLFLFLRAAIVHGRMPADHRLTRDNLATRRLRELRGDTDEPNPL